MKVLYLLLSFLVISLVRSEPQIEGITSYVRYIIGGGENGEDIAERVHVLSVICRNEEMTELTANDVELITESGKVVADNVAVRIYCGSVIYEADTKVVSYTPLTSGLQIAASSQTVELEDSSLEYMYQRKKAFTDMSQYVEVIEDMKRRRSHYDRRRSTAEDAALDLACQTSNAGDKALSALIGWLGFGAEGAPKPTCSKYLDDLTGNSESFAGCVDYVASAATNKLTNCVYQLTKAVSQYSNLEEQLNQFKDLIFDAITSVYDTLESMQASIRGLADIVRVNSARIDNLNNRQLLLEQEQNNLSNDVIGIMQLQQAQNYLIGANNANIGLTNAQLIGTDQAMERNSNAMTNSLRRMSDQIESLNINFNAALEYMETAVRTQNALNIQDLTTKITIAIRQVQTQLVAMIEDVSMQNLDSDVQTERSMNTLKSAINRLGADVTDLRKQMGLMFNSVTNITSFELGNQGLAVVASAAMDMRESMGYKVLVSESNPGKRPMNLSDYNLMGVIELDLKTYFFNGDMEGNDGCDSVLNQDWKDDMNKYYTEVARANYRVPISFIRQYLRVGDEVLLKFTEDNTEYVMCSSCSACPSCSGGSRVCFNSDCGANQRMFTIRLKDEFLQYSNTSTSTVTRLLKEYDEVVFVSNGLVLYFQEGVESTCITLFNEFDEFSGETTGLSIDAATFTILPVDGIPNITFPWIHRDRELYLQPKIADEDYYWGHDELQGTTMCSLLSDGNTTIADIRIDNESDPVLRRRSRNSPETEPKKKQTTGLKRKKRFALSDPIVINNVAYANYGEPDTVNHVIDFGEYVNRTVWSSLPAASQLQQLDSQFFYYPVLCDVFHSPDSTSTRGTVVAIDIPTTIRVQILQNFDLSFSRDDLVTDIPLGSMLQYDHLTRDVGNDGIMALMITVPRGMRLQISGTRPKLLNAESDCEMSFTGLESGSGVGKTITGYSYQPFTLNYNGPQDEAVEDFATYIVYGVMQWKMHPGDGTDITFRATRDPNSSANVLLRCLDVPYEDLKALGACPPHGFSKQKIYWARPGSSMEEVYNPQYDDFSSIVNVRFSTIAFHNVKYGCVDLCDSPVGANLWKYDNSGTVIDIIRNSGTNTCSSASSVYKDYFSTCTSCSGCAEVDYDSWDTSFGDAGSCNTMLSQNLMEAGVINFFESLPALSPSFTDHFRPGKSDGSGFGFDLQIRMCYPSCDQVKTEQDCSGVHGDRCVWKYTSNTGTSTCEYRYRHGTQPGHTECDEYSDRYSCIQEEFSTCTWKRSTNSCDYFSQQQSNIVQQITPCSTRFMHFQSISACVPGIDKVTSDYEIYTNDTYFGMGGKGDYCFYRLQPGAHTAECLDSYSSNYGKCFEREIYCDFGFGTEAPNTGKDLTAVFYQDFAEQRDEYLVDNSLLPANFTIQQFCAYYDTSDQDECELKSKDSSGKSMCTFRNNVCTPICENFNGHPEECIENEPFGNCLYKIDVGKCQNNIVDMNSDAQCVNNNCATIRNPCNLYYYNEDACVDDPNDMCTWLYSSEDPDYDAHCILKIEVGISACYEEGASKANDVCDVKTIGNGELITKALKSQCAHSTVPEECVQGIDEETGKHCVSISIAGRTFRCKPPGDASINNIVQTYSGNLEVSLYYYENYTESNLITHLIYEDYTFHELHTDVLRVDSQGSPSSYTAAAFGKYGVTLVPNRVETLYSKPCTDAGMQVVGRLCCHQNDTISVVDEEGETSIQCLYNSTSSFYNPAHPANLYLTTAIDLCGKDEQEFLAQPKRIRFPVYYACKVFSQSYVDDHPECSVDEEAIAGGEFVCHPYIEHEVCQVTQLCERFVNPPCMAQIKMPDGSFADVVRLDNDVLSLLSFSKTYYLYDNSEFRLDDMTEVHARWEGKQNDLFPTNVTEDIAHTLMGKFDRDISLIIDTNTAFYGKHARAWKTSLGEGVQVSRTNNEFFNGKMNLKTDYAYFGFISQTRPHPLIDDMEETGEVPIYKLRNMRARTTTKIELLIDGKVMQTIDATNTIVHDPYATTLPVPEETHFIHDVIPDRGIVVSPPFDKVRPGDCGYIGYFHSHSAEQKTISFERYLREHPDYDPRCMTESPSTYVSSINLKRLNETGYDWCGEQYATLYENQNELEGIINSRYLDNFYRTDSNGTLLSIWWNQTFNQESFNSEEFVSFYTAIQRKWVSLGCSFAFINYVDINDIELYVPDNPNPDEVYYYVIDKLRIFYEEYVTLNATYPEMEMDEIVDLISQALIEPIVVAQNDRQCGNCGPNYGTECKTMFFGKAHGTSSTQSAQNGMCDRERYYRIDWFNNKSGIRFTSREGVSSIKATLYVNFPEVTQTILGSGCPLIETAPICDDIQARCTISLRNPSVEANMVLRGEIISENCGGNRTLNIPPNSVQQFESLLCEGTMTLALYSYNNTLCFSATRSFNYTESFSSIFQPIVNTLAASIQNEILDSMTALIEARLQNVTDIVDIVGDIGIITANMTERIGNLEDLTNVLDGKIRNELDLIQANSSLRFDTITFRVDTVVTNLNSTIERITGVETSVQELTNATQSLIENREQDRAEMIERFNNSTLVSDKLEEEQQKLIGNFTDFVENTDDKLEELADQLEQLGNFTFNLTTGGWGIPKGYSTTEGLSIAATAIGGVALAGVVGLSIWAIVKSVQSPTRFRKLKPVRSNQNKCLIQ